MMKVNPTNPRWLFYLAECLQQQGENDEALNHVNAIISLDSTFDEAYDLLIKICQANGKMDLHTFSSPFNSTSLQQLRRRSGCRGRQE